MQCLHQTCFVDQVAPEPHEIPRLGFVGAALELVTAMLKDVIIAVHPNIDLERLAWIGNYLRQR